MTTDPELLARLDRLESEQQSVEQALWGSKRDPESGLVRGVRRLEEKWEETRRQNYMIMAGVVVAIITPAATILLTRASG